MTPRRLLLYVGVVLLAFNLRPAASSVGPVLEDLSSALAMGEVSTSVLTTLPVVAFGIFGAAAPWLAAATGMHRLTFLALLAVVAGLLSRALTDSVTVFLVMSVLALAGMATANVLLPSLVKLHFPDKVGPVTAAYTTSLAVGLTAASMLTVPVADLGGSWRWGLGAWAVTALLAAAPWLSLVVHDRPGPDPEDTERRTSLRQVAGTRLGWAMALLFGIQSAHAYTIFGWMATMYRDAGFSAATAGLLLGVATGITIPTSLWLPAAAARQQDQTRLMLWLIACFPVGYLGLAFAPDVVPWLWAALLGLGCGVFPVVLTLIGLRSRSHDGTAALSAFTQAAGYVIAAFGPFCIGLLHDATGGWTWPLVALAVSALMMAALAPGAGRPMTIEEQLEARG
ncbi:MFS transporter [Nocardioides caldifontis]|uniref:MFS transporter n=1 Tax=Nocardioides caldifontis TaxID=2588938 RepID=UPI0011DF55CC|nr:MFS transporter [Nocardioides caldifontis]